MQSGLKKVLLSYDGNTVANGSGVDTGLLDILDAVSEPIVALERHAPTTLYGTLPGTLLTLHLPFRWMATLVLEQTPLLLYIRDEHYEVTASQAPEAENALETVQQDHSSFTSSRYGRQLCFLIFLREFSQYLVYARLMAVFEDIICTRHYSKTTHCLLKDCKIVSVPNELAFLEVADFLPVCYYRSFPVDYSGVAVRGRRHITKLWGTHFRQS
ncbi:uncharacterized protein SEPMUDRAFT_114959 [Sphaerulina musiva SO2202]|uniref:Uncharacterized protein n=1 Tax=Sphaerulina musiva (strain SO2202) TaxID=692275 RepID=M3B7T9_SPHMS|nr:uncharacterized protein SEPMUDRAFT_114959 [Sphaerulina musiva SO2202]EMF15897.1 hypothetical protein SEPMUDRAFT_114959 [Sphaerulina musiva SO2202]